MLLDMVTVKNRDDFLQRFVSFSCFKLQDLGADIKKSPGQTSAESQKEPLRTDTVKDNERSQD